MSCAKINDRTDSESQRSLNDMKKMTGLCAGMFLLYSGIGVLAAQGPADMQGPPKVLVIDREFTKPGKDGSLHEKSESAFVNALTAAKWPTHYFAMTSMSGKPRALFFFGYDSFAAWEKDNHDMQKNAALEATLDRANVADGELLESVNQGVYLFDPDLSLHTGDIIHDRYFEISQYHVKPGHRADFIALVKLYQEGYAKFPNANWAAFESYYGEDNGGLYLAISKMASLAEDDASMNDDKKFADAMGPEKMKQVRDLTALSIESEQTNLFEFNPKMSYPPDEWIKADPFWKPKAAAPAAKKPAAPAQ
jgi:hypothetical protein